VLARWQARFPNRQSAIICDSKQEVFTTIITGCTDPAVFDVDLLPTRSVANSLTCFANSSSSCSEYVGNFGICLTPYRA